MVEITIWIVNLAISYVYNNYLKFTMNNFTILIVFLTIKFLKIQLKFVFQPIFSISLNLTI